MEGPKSPGRGWGVSVEGTQSVWEGVKALWMEMVLVVTKHCDSS